MGEALIPYAIKLYPREKVGRSGQMSVYFFKNSRIVLDLLCQLGSGWLCCS